MKQKKTQNPLNQFIGLYPLSKTLRFELRPYNEKTKNNIISAGILAEDNHRAESYKKVKKIIDEYHKAFIERVLKDLVLEEKPLQAFYECYKKSSKEEKREKALQDNGKKLRYQISKAFEKDPKYKTLTGEDLINKELPRIVTTDEEQMLLKEFHGFTTYFKGLHLNRKNMYSNEEKASSIAYRLINENLPKFIDNIRSFQKIADSPIADKFESIYDEYAKEGYMNVNTLNEMFEISFYNRVLTQTQIDLYNAIIGGKTEKDGHKTQGINEYINLYNQRGEVQKKDRLPLLKPLFKQILSDREHISWFEEGFADDQAMLNAIKDFYLELTETEPTTTESILDRTKSLLRTIADYDLTKIYLEYSSLSKISQQIFGEWDRIKRALEAEYDATHLQRKKAKTYEEQKEKHFSSIKSVSIGFIDECLKAFKTDKQLSLSIKEYIAQLGKKNDDPDLIDRITASYKAVKAILTTEWPKERNITQEKDIVALIKDLLDRIKDLQSFIKPLLGSGKESDKDNLFYGELASIWETINTVTPLYDKVRNRMTRKPYSTQKFKVNFRNSHFLSYWSQDYETKGGVLFEKEGLYYLAIIDKKLKAKDIEKLHCTKSNAFRIIIDTQKPDNKNTPRLFIRSKGENYAPAVDEYKLPIHEIIDLYDRKLFKKPPKEASLEDSEIFKASLTKLIDYFKLGFSRHESYRHYKFNWKKSDEYKDIDEFYQDTIESCYQIIHQPINWDVVEEYIEEGKIYLFQIYNKDFSPHSKGTPNMHTLYWKTLFDERNLANVVYKLNGEAEIFFREASLERKVTHPANDPIKTKNPKTSIKEKTFAYDLIKDKRYTEDKFQLHVPITMNFKSPNLRNINSRVNNYIKTAEDLHFIGIDRGERNLLYVCVIDSKGNIKDQYSLNEIVTLYNRTDYKYLLEKREEERDKERKSWQTIENIKDLKQGYLSQVVHKIAQLVVQYHAIVVLEDLNSGFKRSRQKVEKSVYQQFEKSLIDKLNYLVDKQLPIDEEGGVLRAYQLTNKFESFKTMKMQNGFLFYIPAWNTSKMDPTTGFVNLFDTRYTNIDKSKEFFDKFEAIRYNEGKDWFELEFDYENFTEKAEGTQTQWTLCTWGERINTFRNKSKSSSWDYKKINLTEEYKTLFEQFSINYRGNLKKEILEQNSKDFFERLLSLLHLTLQMRNSIPNTDTDYLISPVADANGHFYYSEQCGDNLPKNADANGAYNIARKGMWMAEQIRRSNEGEELKLAISNKEWLRFAQEKPYLEDK